jgi:hypothetical protein
MTTSMSQWLNILCIMFKIFQTPLFTHYNVGCKLTHMWKTPALPWLHQDGRLRPVKLG